MCYIRTIYAVLLFAVFHLFACDDIHIESNFIVDKEFSPSFEQWIDISSLNKSYLSICMVSSSFYCIKWNDGAQFNVSKSDVCNDFEYKSSSLKSLNVTFLVKNTHIYGGAERRTQTWPIESSSYPANAFPFVTSKVESQSIVEPLWLFSNGIYVYVDKQTPLFVSSNLKDGAGNFSIIAKNEDPYIQRNYTLLKYRVCKLPDIKAAYIHANKNLTQRPNSVLDADTIRKPIWSTWAKFKKNISEKVVNNFISEISKHNFPISHVEIDDKWETCYGSLTVDPVRFPDMKKLVASLHKQHIKTTMWVHPFINIDCEEFHDVAKNNSYFVKNDAGNIVQWWNGNGSYLDFTNPAAYEWYRNRLVRLKNSTGVDAFKFDAGESDWAPDNPIFKNADANYPDSSLKNYVKLASSFGNMVEVRVAKGTQQYSIFVRMIDRQSSWNKNLGLQSLIPTLLLMNVIGYPFVLPDMIGGNEYNSQVPDEELYIRWLQVNVFMPTMQFSIPPWDYGKNVSKIAMKMIKIHNSFSNNIMESMKRYIKIGTPVNPPLWWIDPNDNVTYTIDSQFLLGEDIVVAPVVTKGAKSRDIYLPKGIWIDGNYKKGKKINGPKWLLKYPANLDTLPYFIKIQNTNSGTILSFAVGLLFLNVFIFLF